MRRKRSERAVIYNQIVEVLKEGKQNILQISEKTNINWQTVKNALDTLESINLVKKEDLGNKLFYSIEQPQIETPKNTLLNLPIKEEKLTKQIAKRIREIWQKETNTEIKKTFLQKILVKTIKKENLQIPYGWYIFGQCAVLQINPINLDINSTKDYDKTITKAVKEYKEIQTTNQLLLNHYREENNSLYLDRLKIINILDSPFNKESMELLNVCLKDMVFTFQGSDDVYDYLDVYYSLAVQLFRLNNVEEFRQILLETFMALWALLASDNLYNSLKDFYPKEILDYCYKQRKISLIAELEEYLYALQDAIPKQNKSSPLDKFKGIAAKQSQ